MPNPTRFHRLLLLLLLACVPSLSLGHLPAGAATNNTSLYLPLAANARQVIVLDLDANQPALSPDNEVIVFVGKDSTGGVDLYMLPVTGGSLTKLTDTPAIVEETPVFSPSGLSVVFAANMNQNWSIFARALDNVNAFLLVSDSGADEVHPSFSADGARLLFASNRAGGNWDIYSADLAQNPEQPPLRLTSEPTTERFPIGAQGGTVVFRREQQTESGWESRLYAMSGDGSFQRPLTGAGNFIYPGATPAHAGLVYVVSVGVTGPYALMVSNLGAGSVGMLAPAAIQAASPRLSYDGSRLVYTVAVENRHAIVVEPFSDPLLQVGRAGYDHLTDECSWENGVMATGWVKAWRATGDAQYAAWVRAWVDGCLQRGAVIEHANDVPLAYAALALHAEMPDVRYWALAEQAAAYIFEGAQRAPDGTLIHLDNMVWDDTLIGITPFLLSMYAATAEQRYLEEAIDQVLKHSAHLQDPATGLYHHAWRPATNTLDGPAFWGRGNGWVVLAVADLLAALPHDHELRGAVQAVFTRHAAGLVAHQDGSGRWRTVINRPDAYLETSASALIAAGLATGLREGDLDRAMYGAPVSSALAGVWSQVNAGGIVGGVSAPTWPMPEDEYLERPISSFERYGQGVVLLMGAAFAPGAID